MKHIITFAVIHFFFLIAMLSLSDEKIDFKNKKIYIGYIFTLILLVLNFELSLVSIRVVLNIIIYVILAQFLFAKGIKESILLGMSVTVIGIFSEIIYGFLAYPMLNQTLFVEEAVLTAIINNFFIGIILVFLCSHKPFKNLYQIVLSTTNKINDGYIMVFSLLIIIIFNFICWISYFVFKELLSHYYLLFISSSLSIFGFLLVFFYFKANNKYLTVYEKYNISLDSIREFELMIENYRINTHENKNQFRTIRNMSKNKKINSYIDALLNETAVEVDISKIKIPKIFSKPNPKKMQKKIEYYRKNHKFESQIVIDTDYTLLDGYTSYLIAKNYNKGSVIVKLKRKKKQYCENCGIELTKSNKYMEGMCMECKCGIDYEEK